MVMIDIQNPHEPEILDETSNGTIIECSRCTVQIPCGIYGVVSSDQGEMITEINDTPQYRGLTIDITGTDYPHETESCSVCNGTERVQVAHTPPLPTCIRCRGRGSIIDDKVEKIQKHIDKLDRRIKEKKEKRDVNNIIGYMKSAISSTEDEKKLRELKDDLPDNSDARILAVETCPICRGSGIDKNERRGEEGYLTECQRCTGIGRMVTECASSNNNAVAAVANSCDVCLGEGTVTVDAEPPFVTCSNCSGRGEVYDGETTALGHPTDIATCTVCGGYGFSTTDEINKIE